jgi:hypothetical protein
MGVEDASTIVLVTESPSEEIALIMTSYAIS